MTTRRTAALFVGGIAALVVAVGLFVGTQRPISTAPSGDPATPDAGPPTEPAVDAPVTLYEVLAHVAPGPMDPRLTALGVDHFQDGRFGSMTVTWTERPLAVAGEETRHTLATGASASFAFDRRDPTGVWFAHVSVAGPTSPDEAPPGAAMTLSGPTIPPGRPTIFARPLASGAEGDHVLLVIDGARLAPGIPSPN